MAVRGKKFIALYILLYAIALLYLHVAFEESFGNYLLTFSILGIGFSAIAIWLTKDLSFALHTKTFTKEIVFVIVLVALIGFYITYGGTLVNNILPAAWFTDERIASVIIFVKKFIFFVAIPFTIYKALGFSLDDFGLKKSPVSLLSKRAVAIFISLATASLLFQYFLSNGGKNLQQQHFNAVQLIAGIPLCFVYLLFDAGLIEEFFFRGFLQGRLTALLRSETGAIVVSAIIFGLVHAPGLYLRGAASEGIDEQLPFLFFAAYTITYISIAGIFLGIIYSKTKNLWLVMALHAVLDLLPNFSDFIHTWHL